MSADEINACIRISDHGEVALWLLAISAAVVAVTLIVGHIHMLRRAPSKWGEPW